MSEVNLGIHDLSKHLHWDGSHLIMTGGDVCEQRVHEGEPHPLGPVDKFGIDIC
jgi:hypothetical protein